MEPTLIATLLVLALVDATSVGTLGIPVWLGLQSRVRTRAIVVYLAAIAGFYLVVGLVLYAGALAAFQTVVDATEGDARLVAQLVVGVGLFALSFKVAPIGGRPERVAPQAGELAVSSDGDIEGARAGRSPSRIERLKAKASGEGFDGRAAVVLALAAASVELLMMLPYLAAIGMLADAAPGTVVAFGTLAVYVAVMVAPAAALLALRVVAERRAAELLGVVQCWVDRHAAEALGWALGVGGFFLAAGAARGLGLGE